MAINSTKSLTTNRAIYLGTLGLLCVFLLLSCYRAYPYVDNVSEARSAGNDWLTYKLNALNILHEGLTMPGVDRNYHLPGGFLYNYFIAAVFALCGENSQYVYIVQAVLLALSIGLTVLAFKPFLTQKTVAVYFVTLTLVTFIDVFVFYTFRLLSENLVLFLLPVFYFLILRTFKRQSVLLASLAGAVLGLCVLNRQNLILLAPATATLLFIYLKGQTGRTLVSSIFLVCFCLIVALLPLRNYEVTGETSIPFIRYSAERLISNPEINNLTANESPSRNALAIFDFYARRILFCAGLTVVLKLPAYWLKPHWMLMWLGAFIYIRRLLKRRCLEFWEAFALVFILMYLAPLLAIANINTYGVRMVLPVIPVVLLLGVNSLTRGTVGREGAAIKKNAHES